MSCMCLLQKWLTPIARALPARTSASSALHCSWRIAALLNPRTFGKFGKFTKFTKFGKFGKFGMFGKFGKIGVLHIAIVAVPWIKASPIPIGIAFAIITIAAAVSLIALTINHL